jgi:hypothetical protein
MIRALFAAAAAVLLIAHFTGGMAKLTGWFDIGIDPRHVIYLAAMPFACAAGLLLLRN